MTGTIKAQGYIEWCAINDTDWVLITLENGHVMPAVISFMDSEYNTIEEKVIAFAALPSGWGGADDDSLLD